MAMRDEPIDDIDVSNFTLVVSDNRPLLLDSAVEESILCTLSERDMTQTEIAKTANIPTTTAYNHLQRMCDLGLVVTIERDNKIYYHNNSKVLLSTDYSRITPGVGDRLVSHIKDGGNVYMYSFLWTMVEFESLGIDPSFVASEFGIAVGKVFNKDDKSDTVEHLIDKMGKFIVEKGFADTFDVMTYLPLTFHSEHSMPFMEYPIDQMQHIIINIVKCILENFTKEMQYPFNVKIGDNEEGKAYMEFSLSSSYRPEGDPWKTLEMKHR